MSTQTRRRVGSGAPSSNDGDHLENGSILTGAGGGWSRAHSNRKRRRGVGEVSLSMKGVVICMMMATVTLLLSMILMGMMVTRRPPSRVDDMTRRLGATKDSMAGMLKTLGDHQDPLEEVSPPASSKGYAKNMKYAVPMKKVVASTEKEEKDERNHGGDDDGKHDDDARDEGDDDESQGDDNDKGAANEDDDDAVITTTNEEDDDKGFGAENDGEGDDGHDDEKESENEEETGRSSEQHDEGEAAVEKKRASEHNSEGSKKKEEKQGKEDKKKNDSSQKGKDMKKELLPVPTRGEHNFKKSVGDATAPSCDKELKPEDIDYTLVTQSSEDRLWMMKHHCKRWGGKMSLVVYTDDSVEKIRKKLSDMGCRKNQLELLQTLGHKGYADDEYPVNKLRNMALSVVKTTHVVYVDVDFWESENLRKALQKDKIRAKFAEDSKVAMVVPAFQLNRQCNEYRDCKNKNIAKMPKTKKEVVHVINHKQGAAFDPTNFGGHGSTDYGKWHSQGPGELAPIKCIKSNRYEPYLVFRYCDALPPFQEEFTGYGKNKMTWVMQLRRTGYLFYQLGDIFVVHYPHLDSKVRIEWNRSPPELSKVKVVNGKKRRVRPADLAGRVDWSSYKRGKVDQIYVDFREWLEDEVEDNHRTPICSQSADDDMKLWVDHRQLDRIKQKAKKNQKEKQKHDKKRKR